MYCCNNLSFDLVHCGGIVFSLHLPSFGSSPKTIALHVSGYFRQVVPEDSFRRFCSSPSACVSPIPHEVPNEGLSPVGTSSLLLYGVFPFGRIHRFIGAHDYGDLKFVIANAKTWMMPILLEVASALQVHYCTLRICNMHLESWWVAVGNKNVCVAPAIASHFRVSGTK